MPFTMNQVRTFMVLSMLLLAQACHAGGSESAGRIGWPKAYVQECAACHVAYPPHMLPAASWARLMGGLDKHFGTDASLDARDIQQLSSWLKENADRHLAVPAPPENRITGTAQFERTHRQIEPATWQLPSVRSKSNCMACHTGADKGQYSEHGLRMPQGLSARQRAAWND